MQFAATPELVGHGDVEVSKTTQFAVADATLLGHGDIGVELPHVFTFAADGDRITEGEFSDTVTFTFSASGDAMKDAEFVGSDSFTVGEAELLGVTDLDLITIMKGDYNDEIVVFKPDYNDSITIVMPDYQSEQTILDVDVAA